MMKCSTFKTYCDRYLNKELDDFTFQLIRKHLITCPTCMSFFQNSMISVNLIKKSMPLESLGQDFTDRVMQAVEKQSLIQVPEAEVCFSSNRETPTSTSGSGTPYSASVTKASSGGFRRAAFSIGRHLAAKEVESPTEVSMFNFSWMSSLPNASEYPNFNYRPLSSGWGKGWTSCRLWRDLWFTLGNYSHEYYLQSSLNNLRGECNAG